MRNRIEIKVQIVRNFGIEGSLFVKLDEILPGDFLFRLLDWCLVFIIAFWELSIFYKKF